MVKELVQFSELLTDDFKVLGTKPKVGIHIMLSIKEKDGEIYLDVENYKFSRCTKKTSEDDFLTECKMYHLNAWCIDTNKCFDLPMKAVHSCSPFCVAFKREHLEGGAKFIANIEKGKTQLHDRFTTYFEKAFELLEEEEIEKYRVFRQFFTQKNNSGYFQDVLDKIEDIFKAERDKLESEIESLKNVQSATTDKEELKNLKSKIAEISSKLAPVAEIDDSEYLIFYLNEPLGKYKKAHQNYLSDKLFNSDKYNTKPDEDGLIYGTNNFLNGFNVSKPFLTHKTASFDITGRISNHEALKLYDFQNILRLNTLPNPLPIFIYEEELNEDVIAIFKESEERTRYGEIIKKLFENRKKDLENYYLLFSQNTKDGLVIKDFDFVPKFKFNLKSAIYNESFWEVKPHFTDKYTLKLHSIFDFQNQILPVIFNNNLIVRTKDKKVIVKYFGEIKQEYCKSGPNYLSVIKYRKAFYDFVYKSQRKAITERMFDDIMKVSILEDIRLDKIKDGWNTERHNIEKKLNIWFSLREEFNLFYNKNTITMASKLTAYREFMKKLAANEVDDSEAVKTEEFAYAAGQVIKYIQDKSKTEDGSYKRLEPYLQQVSCEGIKGAIARDFARYKHQNYSRKFENAAAFVLTYQTDVNLKKFLPELLAGIFSSNELYADKKEDVIAEK